MPYTRVLVLIRDTRDGYSSPAPQCARSRHSLTHSHSRRRGSAAQILGRNHRRRHRASLGPETRRWRTGAGVGDSLPVAGTRSEEAVVSAASGERRGCLLRYMLHFDDCTIEDPAHSRSFSWRRGEVLSNGVGVL